jgi:hypothetical protein
MTYDFYNLGQYSTEFIWKMVSNYSVISQIDDIASASWDEVKQGFINVLDCGKLRPTIKFYLDSKNA